VLRKKDIFKTNVAKLEEYLYVLNYRSKSYLVAITGFT